LRDLCCVTSCQVGRKTSFLHLARTLNPEGRLQGEGGALMMPTAACPPESLLVRREHARATEGQ
jgi:hypothetical protein